MPLATLFKPPQTNRWPHTEGPYPFGRAWNSCLRAKNSLPQLQRGLPPPPPYLPPTPPQLSLQTAAKSLDLAILGSEAPWTLGMQSLKLKGVGDEPWSCVCWGDCRVWSQLILQPGVCRELRVYRVLAHLRCGPGQGQACGWFTGRCGAGRCRNRKWDGGAGGVEQGCGPGTFSAAPLPTSMAPSLRFLGRSLPHV